MILRHKKDVPPNPIIEKLKRRKELEALHYSKIEMNHRGLCELARRLLVRKNVFNCTKAWAEICAGNSGEIADAYGLNSYSSVLIEVKMSISDFKADARKPHRQAGQGVGDFRYYMTPKGLLTIDMLPPKWGLIEVDDKRRCRIVTGHLLDCYDNANDWRHETDNIAERALLLWKMKGGI